MKNGEGIRVIMPTYEEDAEINRQIAADPDDSEWTEENFANAMTGPEFFASIGMQRLPISKTPKLT